ncbi:MAG TPA: ABC transporter permease [Phycisphaerae bacterium]|nr:ABC transporter permease [Phycisphaerae bacterium]
MTTTEIAPVQVTVSRDAGGNARVGLAGRLDATTLPEAWSQAVIPIRKNLPAQLTVDVAGLSYCDGAGLGLFAELRRSVAVKGGSMQLTGVRPEQQRFLDMSVLKDPLAGQLQPAPQPGSITQLGKSTWLIIEDLRQLVAFTGELTVTLFWAATHPHKVRVRETLRIAQKAGADALGVVNLLGLLIGLILAFQTAAPLERFGAQPMIPTIVAIAMAREMAALITAIILAGRSGSAFAAEIGTMQVTEELAALKTLGLEPVRFLVVPRVLAAMLVTPLLSVFCLLLSLVGAYIVMAALGYSLSFYVNAVIGAITYRDFLGGVFKAFVFALIVAAIGCLRGMQTKSGPGAVGDSTTRAVVAGIVLTILADAVLGVVFYYIGI